ncbi:MAG: NnrS family protein [Candidatus Competibacteraceae bacterium]|nr:NnrS family protein [Candidatus Competibacteraceae bacterium]
MNPQSAIWNLGFRPFFLGATIFAVVSMLLWMGVYLWQWPLSITGISIFQWHAHEMIYGFAVAVIAGFLLTAVKNWTGVQTLHGVGLLALFGLWVAARVLWLFGTPLLFGAGFFDLLFMLGLIAAIVDPIRKAKQWQQSGIIAILVLLLLGNGLFYLGATGLVESGVFISLRGGLFLIVGLVLFMGRRVIPFFIEAGVGYPIKVRNSQQLDLAIIFLYSLFLIVEAGLGNEWLVALLALALLITNCVRLVGWYTPGIWKKPLLWSLFIAFAAINFGFLLMALTPVLNLPALVVLHAFSVGGIGVMILSMMARVTLGHTGRNVQKPPQTVPLALMVLIAGAVVRVIVPLLVSTHYLMWVAISQLLWIAAFLIFLISYLPMLVKPRVDGQFG